MPIKKLATGCAPLDSILDGGFGAGEVSLVYGERGTGKTTLAFQTISRAASEGQGCIMVYTEGRIPLKRLMEISGAKWPAVSDSSWFREVKTFEEQDCLIDDLEHQAPSGTVLLVVDSITGCYRAELGLHDENVSINKALNREMALLKDVCRRTGLAAILTSEVRARLNGQGIQPVASAILTYWSDRILRLEKLQGCLRKAVISGPRAGTWTGAGIGPEPRHESESGTESGPESEPGPGPEREALIKLQPIGFTVPSEV